MNNQEKYIDLKRVFREKSPGLARWIPGFVLNYIRQVVHEDDINETMCQIGHLYGLEFVNAALEQLHTRVKTIGLENIPVKGGCILAANHPLGGLDGIAFMKAVGEVRSDMKFLVNDILLNIKNFEPLFLPVNKHGINPRVALKLIDEAYASDQAILVFPAGLVSRKLQGGIRDLEWQKSFVTKALHYKKDIIPVHIGGRNSNFFYNLARLRGKLGLKTNIEMLYLPDEMFNQRGKTITLTFGKPVLHEYMEKSNKTPRELTEEIRKIVYSLPRLKP